MIHPKVSLEAWLSKYPDLKIVTKECDACGKTIRTTIPFISKDYVGLDAPRCECGKNKFSCAISITRTPEANQEWAEALGYSSVHSM